MEKVATLEKWFAKIENDCTAVAFMTEPALEFVRSLSTRFVNETKTKTTHYGGEAAFFKLFAPDLLNAVLLETFDNNNSNNDTSPSAKTFVHPEEMRIIVLDTDQIFLQDIGHILPHFEAMEKNGNEFSMPCIERVTNTYLPDALLQNGKILCISSVILMQPLQMHRTNWTERLISTVAAFKRTRPDWTLKTGDQDVLNLFAVKNPTQFYQLPCEWNCYNTLFAQTWSANEMPAGCNHRLCKVAHYNAHAWRGDQGNFFPTALYASLSKIPSSYLHMMCPAAEKQILGS